MRASFTRRLQALELRARKQTDKEVARRRSVTAEEAEATYRRMLQAEAPAALASRLARLAGSALMAEYERMIRL